MSQEATVILTLTELQTLVTGESQAAVIRASLGPIHQKIQEQASVVGKQPEPEEGSEKPSAKARRGNAS